MKKLFFAAAMAGFAMASLGAAQAQPEYAFVPDISDASGHWQRLKARPSGDIWILKMYPSRKDSSPTRNDSTRNDSWWDSLPDIDAGGNNYIMTWADAQKACAARHDGVGGWRLPTFAEVKSYAFNDKIKNLWIDAPGQVAYFLSYQPEAIPVFSFDMGAHRLPRTLCVHAAYTPGKAPATPPVAQAKNEKPSKGAVLTATKQPEAKPLPKASAEQKGPPTAPVDPAPKTKKRIAKWNEQVLEVGKTEAEARAKVEAGRTKVIAEKTKNAPTWRVGSETPITCGAHGGGLVSCRKTITFNYEEEYYPGAKAPGGSAKTISK